MKFHPAINTAYLAKRIGVSRQFLHLYLKGERTISSEKLELLKEVLSEINAHLVSNGEND